MKSISKYQIFISSTYENLKLERQHAIKAILDSNCIPSAMEYFPASNITIQQLISDILSDCDFVVLILSDSYGSKLKNQNLSYTEIEYNISCEKNLPICCFLKSDIDQYFSIDDDLKRFVNRIRKASSPIKKWKCALELESNIKTSISHMKEKTTLTGWVRNYGLADQNMFLNRLHLENQFLEDEVFRKNGEISSLLNEISELEKLAIFYQNRGDFYRKPQKKTNSLITKILNKSSMIEDLLNTIDELQIEQHNLLKNLSIKETNLGVCNEISNSCQHKLRECRESLIQYKSELSFIQKNREN